MINTEMLQKIRSYSVKDYGVYASDLADLIEAKPDAGAVVAALNNADTEGVWLEVLKNAPEKVFGGMKIMAEACGAKVLELHIPAYAAGLMDELAGKAAESGITMVQGLVNRRANANSIMCHIVSMAELYDAAAGTAVPGIYVSVNGAPLEKISADTVIGTLAAGDVKAVQIGYMMYGRDVLGKTVGEMNPENGVIRILGNDICVISEVERHLLKCRAQSCGKCVFCREGLIQLQEMHKDITLGRGRQEYTDLSVEIGEAMSFSTPCSMGQRSAEMALTAIKYFPDEYEAHIKRKKCPADACHAFRKVYVDPKKCTGCAECMPACPEDCIDGAEGYIHVVADFACTKCGKCLDACPEKAIVMTTGKVPKLPDRMLRVGRFK